MDNPYAPPRSVVADTPPDDTIAVGSIEGALAGAYRLRPGVVARQAWARIDGHKLQLFLAAALQGTLSFGSATLLNRLTFSPESKFLEGHVWAGLAASEATGVALLPLTAPLLTGVLLMGLDVARGTTNAYRPFGWAFRRMMPLALASLLTSLFTTLGYTLLVVPGVYLGTAYAFAPMLVVDRRMGVWEAMELSRRAVTRRWIDVFLCVAACWTLVSMAFFVPVFGVIWCMPTGLVMYGLTYRAIFGDP